MHRGENLFYRGQQTPCVERFGQIGGRLEVSTNPSQGTMMKVVLLKTTAANEKINNPNHKVLSQ